jgi:general secretion pathway protein I
MRRKSDGRDHERGFTLIEVLVALIITIAAVAVLYGTTGGAMSDARKTTTWRQAVSRAQSRLASVTDPNVMLGERAGDDGDGYHWRTNISLAAIAPSPPGTRSGPWARGTALYAVSVTISWKIGNTERDFALNSAVLGPVPGSGTGP